MIAWKQSLAGYEWLIHQIWYLEVKAGEEISPKPHLIPNARAHLLFTPAEQSYSYDNGEQCLSGQGSHLLTANENLLLLDDHAPLKRIGITFRPESLYVLNTNSVSNINQCEWFDWLSLLFDDQFQQGLWQHTTSQTQLIQHIRQHLDKLQLQPSRNNAYIVAQKATAALEASQLEQAPTDAAMDIENLARAAACSRRTLERSFKQVLGLSVKQYLQMMRLEQMILALYQQEHDVDWTRFSQQFGFSDQSHLIRTLKQQLKQTPSKYLKQRDLTIDIYGDFE
ncbi:helix-turn-helix domain-containing protein [Vibrio scophthalmi]|uniref:HTH-type transcriptional regulator, AraC family protein n=1 Tax=Vibrio scophthalmi LMG 19158 TaxID=870967 RepID=F9RMV2_9VIBR|nr:helix-turn-helix domain-containing protein [Vibrio scophthalmi]EGU37896.1 HTH-type transcriptional regulator, AraC family protein [Vibrio scophthalmi LMG 19158]